MSGYYFKLIAGEETESGGEIERFERNTLYQQKSLPWRVGHARSRASHRRCRGPQNVFAHSRPPFCEVSGKSREKSTCSDWLTVTNTRFQMDHT